MHPSGRLPAATAIIVFAVPFLLQYDYLLNGFYHFGVAYYDAGFFANLLWHNDILLTTPGPQGAYTFLAVHFSPLLIAVNALSYVIPLGMVSYFCMLIAGIYAGLALAMFYVLCVTVRPTRAAVALAILAIAFAFHGLVMQGIWMPHFEYAIPLFIFLFLFHLFRDDRALALLFFCIALSIREDAGFHITAVLGLVALLAHIGQVPRSLLRPAVIYSAASISYSCAAFIMVFYLRARWNVPGSVFQEIYTGYSPYSHLSVELLEGRINRIFAEEPYLWLSALVTVGWAIIKKHPFVAIGFMACVPWFLLNITAFNDNTGYLYSYYAFPFVLSVAWPVLGYACRFGKNLPRAGVRDAITLQAILILIGLISWDSGLHTAELSPLFGARWGSYALQDEVIDPSPVLAFIHTLDDSGGALGRTMVDRGVMSLAVSPNHGQQLIPLGSATPVDTVAYFNFRLYAENKPVVEIAERYGLKHRYRLIRSSICLVTNRTQLGPFTPMLTAASEINTGN